MRFSGVIHRVLRRVAWKLLARIAGLRWPAIAVRLIRVRSGR
jgi:hypothetical protein